jgi:hypothetical protein
VHRESPIVLLVDDHEDSAAMYAIGLLAMGFQPVTAVGPFRVALGGRRRAPRRARQRRSRCRLLAHVTVDPCRFLHS